MFEGFSFKLFVQQRLYLGQVEERHLHLVALLHLAEDALQTVHIVFIDEAALTVAQRDIFLLAILLQERAQRHLLVAQHDGGRPFEEIDARRQLQVHLRLYGLHLVFLQPLGSQQLEASHQFGQRLQQERACRLLRNDELAVVVPHVFRRHLCWSLTDNHFPQIVFVLSNVGVHDAAQQYLMFHRQRGQTGQVETLGKVGIDAWQRVRQPPS